jgi:Fe2+ or Zn2+ uptake regulation protein
MASNSATESKAATPGNPGLAGRTEAIDPRAEIVAYLAAHPHAADSLDGIVDWWLPNQRYETARSTIQAALDDLGRQGIVEEVVPCRGTRLYRLATGSGHAQ